MREFVAALLQRLRLLRGLRAQRFGFAHIARQAQQRATGAQSASAEEQMHDAAISAAPAVVQSARRGAGQRQCNAFAQAGTVFGQHMVEVGCAANRRGRPAPQGLGGSVGFQEAGVGIELARRVQRCLAPALQLRCCLGVRLLAGGQRSGVALAGREVAPGAPRRQRQSEQGRGTAQRDQTQRLARRGFAALLLRGQCTFGVLLQFGDGGAQPVLHALGLLGGGWRLKARVEQWTQRHRP